MHRSLGRRGAAAISKGFGMSTMRTNGASGRSLSRGILVVTTAWLAGVLAVLLVMLAYDRYRHDIKTAESNAERISKLLTTSILSTMMKTGDRNHVRSLIEELKTRQDFNFRIYRGPNVERQYGVVEDERPNDEASRKVFETRKPLKVYPDDTTLRHFTPLITDERCGQCHQDLSGNPVPPGVMQGAYEVIFDLRAVKAGSVRSILQTLALLVLGLGVFGFLLYRLIVSNVLDPIRQMLYVVSGWEQGDFTRPMPESHSAELADLARLLDKHAKAQSRPAP
jgi:hypothetical protein